MAEKTRYALVGTGGRARTFIDSLTQRFADSNELVAFCDVSPTRMQYHSELIAAHGIPAPRNYLADQFDAMLEAEKPDGVVVTCTDKFHDLYINKAVAAGLRVVTEKPMTIDAPRCQSILDTVAKHQGDVRVTFNYRFMDICTRVKELLLEGTIGNLKAVNLEYMLDTGHGADYFRRWHSYLDMCGGLLVHKSTHHFDLVNWWVDSIVDEVFAFGALSFYGKDNAIARGDEKYTGYPRYTGQPEAANDPFALVLDGSGTTAKAKKKGEGLKRLYYNAEADSGYLRDQNVFREGITSFDNMSVTARYRNGVFLTYSLIAFSRREGMRVTFYGDKGSIELGELGGSHIITGQSDEELAKEQNEGFKEDYIRVFPHFQTPYEVEIPKSEKGGHGGSDPRIQEQLFSPHPPEEKLGRNAGHEQGAASILVGIAANTSIAEKRNVTLTDLVNLKPDAVRLSELV